ncbi:hypothetical protein [Hansschlegelia sp. KR7-227]|uniref:hypothetical protein n=1 Tax=Hansschlegelia sp. KR7-227 TaxID=3400914 RepID=UPI003BFAB3E3
MPREQLDDGAFSRTGRPNQDSQLVRLQREGAIAKNHLGLAGAGIDLPNAFEFGAE